MSVKRVAKKEFSADTLEHLAPVTENRSGKVRIGSGWRWVILILVVIGYFCYKTNSWPVVAIVGGKVITRFEVTQDLMKTYGKEEIENKITERLIRNELDRMNIKVSDDEKNAKIEEIKKSLGEGVNFEELLQGRGMSVDQFRDQLGLQMRVEKGLADKITVSEEEVSKYLVDNKSFIAATGEAAILQAREAVRITKLQDEIGKWIEDLKAKASVWKAPGI